MTSIYVQDTAMASLYIAFGFVGYLMRKLNISVLPFVIAFILANNLETTLRQAFSASGADPFFFFKSPIAMVFFAMIAVIIYSFGMRRRPDKNAAAPGLSTELD